jgi:hypothetical protein
MLEVIAFGAIAIEVFAFVFGFGNGYIEPRPSATDVFGYLR